MYHCARCDKDYVLAFLNGEEVEFVRSTEKVYRLVARAEVKLGIKTYVNDASRAIAWVKHTCSEEPVALGEPAQRPKRRDLGPATLGSPATAVQPSPTLGEKPT